MYIIHIIFTRTYICHKLSKIMHTTRRNPSSKISSRFIVYWLYRLKAYMVMTFWAENQSFRNKSGKTQPIQTKFGIRGQIKEFWGRLAHFGQNGGYNKSRGARGFCVVIQTTFRQLRNGRFSPNLATIRSWLSRRWIRKDFHFKGHLLQNLESKVGQTGTLLRTGYGSRDALQRDTVYSTL